MDIVSLIKTDDNQSKQIVRKSLKFNPDPFLALREKLKYVKR